MNKHDFLTRRLLALALILLSLTSPLAAGEVYKWTDKDGTIHYSDKKPVNVSSESMKIKAGKSTETRSSPQEQAKTLNEKKSEQLANQDKKLQDDTYKRENNARCQTLRNNLVKFKENSRIKINDNGTLRFLTPEEIIVKTTQYQQTLKDECI
jgi:hypothetical protein